MLIKYFNTQEEAKLQLSWASENVFPKLRKQIVAKQYLVPPNNTIVPVPDVDGAVDGLLLEVYKSSQDVTSFPASYAAIAPQLALTKILPALDCLPLSRCFGKALDEDVWASVSAAAFAAPPAAQHAIAQLGCQLLGPACCPPPPAAALRSPPRPAPHPFSVPAV